MEANLMWRFFFELCDILCELVPGRANREWIRRVKLYDYRKKLKCLKHAFPDLNFKKMRLVKGGWNIGFIVDNRYMFKIRKSYDNKHAEEKILREKRITDAFARIVPVKIPKINVATSGEYIFYYYEFIPGVNLNNLPAKQIAAHREKLGRVLGEFIYKMHNAYPKTIADLATPTEPGSDGWNHHDLCNNILVNPETMEITGIIDWEYAGFGPLKTEFRNSILFSRAMMKSSIIMEIMYHYYSLCDKKVPKKSAVKSAKAK